MNAVGPFELEVGRLSVEEHSTSAATSEELRNAILIFDSVGTASADAEEEDDELIKAILILETEDDEVDEAFDCWFLLIDTNVGAVEDEGEDMGEGERWWSFVKTAEGIGGLLVAEEAVLSCSIGEAEAEGIDRLRCEVRCVWGSWVIFKVELRKECRFALKRVDPS